MFLSINVQLKFSPSLQDFGCSLDMFRLRWVANDKLSLSFKVLLEQAHPRLFKEMKVRREAPFVSRLGSQGNSTSSVTVASALE